jgi:hypothetical protein
MIKPSWFDGMMPSRESTRAVHVGYQYNKEDNLQNLLELKSRCWLVAAAIPRTNINIA